ncbi:endonuclease/exonuclease/phosphatase family protein [Winogradskyella thalassocola]|uniref:Metal-dependent hydrolase, endonuclease/exonuclease/phosphatase family n=1 Tax=Winogradskyella thalassocola TaxID=262004 RepID=A0A1G8F2R3_9FLAO|nr:endonuclease/exonuclease/phosphatase family protein [Winogradskyella thalassocola]SDH76299.1 Metal-dependent hydrolase, endonuclease/exonuclease/phosphatase family [Winogradskyella thalassocola]
MKLINILIIGLFFLGCSPKKMKPESNTESVKLKVMTYNIRLDITSDGDNAWPNRKDFLSSQILFLSPDVFGVQEARPNQIEDLNAALRDYKFIGEGRDGNGEGEFSAIYYNSKHLKVEKQHTFWLSDSPTVVSKGWDAAYPRVCTYGLFTSKDTNQKFWVFNTHLDHIGKEAQKEGMKLILRKMASENTQNYPVLLMGDFNVEPNSEVVAEILPTMSDSKHIAALKFGSDGTFNGFQYNEPVTRRIDYLFVSKSPEVVVRKYAVLSSAIDFKFPSDHFPVYAEIELK